MNLALRGRFLPRNLLLQAEGAERAVRCLARAAVQLAVRAQAVKFDYRGRSAPGQPPLRNRQRMCYAHSCMEEYRRAVRAPTLGCPGPLQPSVAICGAMADLWTGQPKKPATERSTRPRDACDPPGPLLMGRQPANSGALDPEVQILPSLDRKSPNFAPSRASRGPSVPGFARSVPDL